ncbi:MAG: cob(I)yrinic acid a,c-diamide adenosyltransferase [Rhodocyclales bacterium]|nr:cob(I)yrinic acid a,c-diamide adenosyltransferase [Rhodocyclales bacterium]
MGHRLSKIYTRTGDAGSTGLGDGSRTGKELLTGIQHDLFDLGGELSVPGSAFLKPGQPQRLETAIDRYNGELQPLKEFILPGGTRAAALTHLARTVSRRAERSVVALAANEPVSETARQYLNRLSDLLFVLARWLNKAAGSGDVLWQKGKNA